MSTEKTIYRFVHPTTGRIHFVEKGGKKVLWATFIDFGKEGNARLHRPQPEGFVHVGFSGQADFAKASKAARGTNPYGQDYTAVALTPVTAEERDAERNATIPQES